MWWRLRYSEECRFVLRRERERGRERERRLLLNKLRWLSPQEVSPPAAGAPTQRLRKKERERERERARERERERERRRIKEDEGNGGEIGASRENYQNTNGNIIKLGDKRS
jgi:hypothetical protein